ncbi:MAG TPA: alpha/beta fold hydrolase [Actinomycetota bacterium]|nr:alpha/beta fold hydrolase [Actinomycetota bacterium]
MLRSLSPRRRLLAVAVVAAVAVGAAGLALALRPGTTPKALPGAVVPVLLVHGYDGTPAEFDRLAVLLAASGRPVVRVALPARGTGDIEASARVVARAAGRTGAARVDLVGYSAGGIVVRAFLDLPGRAATARHVVLLGAPNHGTEIAGLAAALDPRLCPVACSQLAPTSSLLARLNADGTPPGPDYTSIWTSRDETVTPPDSAVLEGARNVRVQDVCASSGVGHGGLVTDPAVLGLVVRALDGALDARPGPSDCAPLEALGARA